MNMASRFVSTCIALFLAGLPSAPAQAQTSLEKLRQSLIAPWLITVQGDIRGGLLRINEIAQESEGSYVLNATHGGIDGEPHAARVELIQSSQELRLVLRSSEGNLFFFRQLPGGDFGGTFRSARGVELPVTLVKLTEDQVPQKAREASARMAARVFADEDKDWGVAQTNTTRSGRLHAPTPTTIPGAKTIRTMELRAMLGQSPPPVLIDVLGGDGHRTITGALWLREPGEATIGYAGTERFRQDLEKLTMGRKSASLVFFCLSSECWMSYNASLRAIEIGYTNVHWYRGGTNAWQRAGFGMREAEPYRR
jgi:PQQ-dependent catabolism-associated CXXCW motif protein